MSVFDKDLFDTGLAKRKITLGEEYVEQSLAKADEFTRPFQEAMTAWCWDLDGVMRGSMQKLVL